MSQRVTERVTEIPLHPLPRIAWNIRLQAFSLIASCLLLGGLFSGCEEASTDSTTSALDPDENGGSAITPLIDSNTNWLLSCSADSDCDEGEQCACGSCVIPCAPEGSEGPRCMTTMGYPAPESIECADAEPVSEVSSCGEDYTRPHASICLLACQSNDECPDHLLCHEGRCKRPRRGESRGCNDERECIEAGGDPQRCRVLCEDSTEGMMSMSSMHPSPPMGELLECERRCTSEGNDPAGCRSRCAVCSERCLLVSDPEEVQRCTMQCHQEERDP